MNKLGSVTTFNGSVSLLLLVMNTYYMCMFMYIVYMHLLVHVHVLSHVCAFMYMYVQVWDVLTLKEIHRISGISQSWVRALAYDKRKVRTCM